MVNRNKIDKAKLFAAAEAAEVARIASTGSSKYSVSVINSDGNGKRVVFSKELVKKLNLNGCVSLLPVKGESVLMVASVLPFENASTIKLTSADKRTAYHAGAVQLIANTFDLDYTDKTSMSFGDVDFIDHEGVTIAVFTIPADKMKKQVVEVGESA